MRERNGMDIGMGGTGLMEAAKLIMEPVCQRIGEPASLRQALDDLYSMLGDEEIDAHTAAGMMLDLIRENDEIVEQA